VVGEGVRALKQNVYLQFVLLGLIAGFLASRVLNRRGDGHSLNMLLAIVGAGYLFTFFGAGRVAGLNVYRYL
jgi:uncharacterized membrane protein YeaQ/YmgE (transglycosylase-associated protein family)